ncbi:MAG: hypothetical protein ABIJ59_00090 [Pseudomonadota bacterium]
MMDTLDLLRYYHKDSDTDMGELDGNLLFVHEQGYGTTVADIIIRLEKEEE